MTGNKNVLGSDLAKVDAHVVQPHEFDEIPELTDEMFDRADMVVGGKRLSRGRPPKAAPKISTTIRLDPDLLDYYRSTGPGWQSRINDALRRVAKI